MNSRYELLTSRTNPKIREAAALLQPAARRETGRFLLEGLRLCADAAENGVEVETCFVSEAALGRGDSRLAALLGAAGRVYAVSDPVAEKLSDTRAPQGVFCVCKKKTESARIVPDAFYVVTEDLQNPDNLGAASRTAEALGAAGLVTAGGCDIYSPKALRASMGALLRFPVLRTGSGAEAVALLRRRGYRVYAAVPHPGAADVTEMEKGPGCAVVIGNEGNGVSEETLAVCDGSVRIPMKGRAESLNAAAAAAILIWEFTKG